jgi:hypothetical protein
MSVEIANLFQPFVAVALPTTVESTGPLTALRREDSDLKDEMIRIIPAI